MSAGNVEVEREGLLWWSWRARGVLRRARRAGGLIVLPTGNVGTLDSGTAFTRRGAERRGRRALRRWAA